MRLARLFFALAAMLAPSAAYAQPSATAVAAVPVGRSTLDTGAIVYRPAKQKQGPAPVLILLHGAGGSPERILTSFVAQADRGGFYLLALKSTDATWDLISRRNPAERDVPTSMEPVLSTGPDTPRILASLTELSAKSAIDPARVVLGGFSDGASYALSLGLARPLIFPRIVALSPGFATAPDLLDIRQRIFIAHGRSDRVLPFESTEKNLVKPLREGGYKVEFRPFDGDHQIDPAIAAAVGDFVRG